MHAMKIQGREQQKKMPYMGVRQNKPATVGNLVGKRALTSKNQCYLWEVSCKSRGKYFCDKKYKAQNNLSSSKGKSVNIPQLFK